MLSMILRHVIAQVRALSGSVLAADHLLQPRIPRALKG
jgi:hypothetical protein